MAPKYLPFPDRLSEADRITWKLGDSMGDDRKWREKMFAKLPVLFQVPIARTYKRLYKLSGRHAANTHLREVAKEFRFLDMELATNEDAIDRYALNRIQEVSSICSRSRGEEAAYNAASQHIGNLGFTAPRIEGMTTFYSALERLRDKRWWKRQIRQIYPEKFEAVAIRCGLVHSKAALYISDHSMLAYETRVARNRSMLATLEMENEEGDICALEDAIRSSVANPVNRRNELMARLYGFDNNAKEHGHLGLFITITCPSRMHARYGKSGDCNPKYDKTTPHEAQQYLCKVWAKIRASLKHAGIHIYGFRVAEPQHDGTPHWHILLYTDNANNNAIRETVLRYALEDSPHEKGALERRCTFKEIDWNLGSGVGYIAKYISKNIDGA